MSHDSCEIARCVPRRPAGPSLHSSLRTYLHLLAAWRMAMSNHHATAWTTFQLFTSVSYGFTGYGPLHVQTSKTEGTYDKVVRDVGTYPPHPFSLQPYEMRMGRVFPYSHFIVPSRQNVTVVISMFLEVFYVTAFRSVTVKDVRMGFWQHHHADQRRKRDL